MVKVNLPNADTSSGKYTEYHFEKAKSLYNVLLNFSDTMDDRDKESYIYYPAKLSQVRWIFRGHWESDWPLLPSAFRGENYEKFWFDKKNDQLPLKRQSDRTGQVVRIKNIPTPLSENPRDNLKPQIEAEYFMLRRFMETANSLGIDCNYTPFFYDYHLKIEKDFNHYQDENARGKKNRKLEEWPDYRIMPVMALAQHHGMLTRLLDFSYNPLFAAFFAAHRSFEKRLYPCEDETCSCKNKPCYHEINPEEIPENKKLCIWAISRRTMKLYGKGNDIALGELSRNPWRVILTSSNRSSNLFAQEGILILDNNANKKFIDSKGTWDNLESIGEYHKMVKLTLPQKECKELLRLLWEYDITPARIMPNLDRVTQTLEYIQWLWTKKESPPLDTPRKTL